MASSGYIYGTCTGGSASAYTFVLDWVSIGNVTTNSSALKIYLTVYRNDGYSNSAYNLSTKPSVTLKVGGTTMSPTIKYIDTREGEHCVFAELSTNVKHKDDGTLKLDLSASFTHYGSDSLTGGSVSGTITLDTIARASTITSVSDVTLGKTCTIKWTPQSKSFRYKLKFSRGNLDIWSEVIHPNTTSAYTYVANQLTVDHYASTITSNPSGTMKVSLYTYTNASATTKVGDESTKEFTATVPDNSSTKPSVTMEIEPVSNLDSPLSSLYIQGKSKVKATTLTGSGKYDAKISSLVMYVNGVSYDKSPYLSDYLPKSGKVTVKGRATDSRGYYNDDEQEIDVIPYSKPMILPSNGESNIVCERCDEHGDPSDSGTFLRIKARRTYSKVMSDDVQNNFCTIRYRYRKETSTSFSEWKTILDATATTDTVDTGALEGVVSSTETSYVVQVGVIDTIGETDVVQFVIPTDFITVDIPEDFRGKSIGIFRHAIAPEGNRRRIDIDGFIHGAGVDTLTLGTMMTASSVAPLDLNDYIIPGNYYSPNKENSANIANTPYTDGGFGLEVRELQHTNYIRQKIYYGRTALIRHWNTTEWSEWARMLITDVPSGVCSDFVVEQGEKDGWSYRKWASGHAECWGSIYGKRTFSSTWGSLYVCSHIPAKDYPFTFIERPTETATMRTSAPACWLYADSSGDGMNTTTHSGIYSATRPTEYTAEFSLYIDIMVKGRWK